jgi:hypothetical protein
MTLPHRNPALFQVRLVVRDEDLEAMRVTQLSQKSAQLAEPTLRLGHDQETIEERFRNVVDDAVNVIGDVTGECISASSFSAAHLREDELTSGRVPSRVNHHNPREPSNFGNRLGRQQLATYTAGRVDEIEPLPGGVVRMFCLCSRHENRQQALQPVAKLVDPLDVIFVEMSKKNTPYSLTRFSQLLGSRTVWLNGQASTEKLDGATETRGTDPAHPGVDE